MSSIKYNGKDLSDNKYLSSISVLSFNQLVELAKQNNNSLSKSDVWVVEERQLSEVNNIESKNLFTDDRQSVYNELPKNSIMLMDFDNLVEKLNTMNLSFKENDCIIISDVDLDAPKNNGNENKSGIPFKHK